jgi:hypothetical protein
MGAARRVVKLDLEDMKLSPTAALFEGKERAGIDITMFVVRTPPGVSSNQMLVVPADTPHGFRNVGDVPLLVVTVHESGTLEQTFLGKEPA